MLTQAHAVVYSIMRSTIIVLLTLLPVLAFCPLSQPKHVPPACLANCFRHHHHHHHPLDRQGSPHHALHPHPALSSSAGTACWPGRRRHRRRCLTAGATRPSPGHKTKSLRHGRSSSATVRYGSAAHLVLDITGIHICTAVFRHF